MSLRPDGLPRNKTHQTSFSLPKRLATLSLVHRSSKRKTKRPSSYCTSSSSRTEASSSSSSSSSSPFCTEICVVDQTKNKMLAAGAPCREQSFAPQKIGAPNIRIERFLLRNTVQRPATEHTIFGYACPVFGCTTILYPEEVGMQTHDNKANDIRFLYRLSLIHI